MQTRVKMRLHLHFVTCEVCPSVFVTYDPNIHATNQQNINNVAFSFIWYDFIDVRNSAKLRVALNYRLNRFVFCASFARWVYMKPTNQIVTD